jgi:hypothetical protein
LGLVHIIQKSGPSNKALFLALPSNLSGGIAALSGTSITYSPPKGFTNNKYSKFPMPIGLSNSLRRTMKKAPSSLRFSEKAKNKLVNITPDGNWTVEFFARSFGELDKTTGKKLRRYLSPEALGFLAKAMDNETWKVAVISSRARTLKMISVRKYPYLAGPWILRRDGNLLLKEIGIPAAGLAGKLVASAIKLLLKWQKQQKTPSSGERRELAQILAAIGGLDKKIQQKLLDIEQRILGFTSDLSRVEKELPPTWAYLELGIKAIVGLGVKVAIIADPNDRREYLYLEVSPGIGVGAKAEVGVGSAPSIDTFKDFEVSLSASLGLEFQIGPLKVSLKGKAEGFKEPEFEFLNGLKFTDLQGSFDDLLEKLFKKPKGDGELAQLEVKIIKIDVGFLEFELTLVQELAAKIKVQAGVNLVFKKLFDIDTNGADNFIYPFLESVTSEFERDKKARDIANLNGGGGH